MDTHGAFSPEMVTVYLAAISAIGVVFKVISDLFEKNMRRKWEVEDRKSKEEQARLANAAAAAIEASRNERKTQLDEVKASVDANTVLTQEAKAASKEAIDVANGHNEKIIQATKLAAAALETAQTKTTN